MAIRYYGPENWMRYDIAEILGELTDAKASVISLTTVPFQKAWADRLQAIQLKHEVAGTSRIEGADFTENELDAALDSENTEDIVTRSQKQARAAVNTYRWISNLDDDRPINAELIREVHRRIVTGCDDDQCEPGALRRSDHNVTFGNPRHRGVEGGEECKRNFEELCTNIENEFRGHDVLIQALAIHYHIGAMHPFGDGNGRTARAVEALLLQRAGLRDALFIALSNYYYDEKTEYLKQLASVRASRHDLTGFLKFGLRGIAVQCRRLMAEINLEIRKSLFRDMANRLFGKLENPRKRVLAERQLQVLNLMLDEGPLNYSEIFRRSIFFYVNLKNPQRAFNKDLEKLFQIGAILFDSNKGNLTVLYINLLWPEQITDSQFFETIQKYPSAQSFKFLQRTGPR